MRENPGRCFLSPGTRASYNSPVRNCARPLPKLQSASVLVTMDTIDVAGLDPAGLQLAAELGIERLLGFLAARPAHDVTTMT